VCEAELTSIGSYQVKIQDRSAGEQVALILAAKEDDMPRDWSFSWSSLWKNTDFECQNIVKLVYTDRMWGLVRYGLYPYPGSPKYLEIEQLEAYPTSQDESADRPIAPIGKWLIWYCIEIALTYCIVPENKPLVVLVSLESAVSYYRDVIMMEYLGPAPGPPGEDLYAFRFSPTAARSFCERQENQYGVPTLVNQ